MIHMEQNKKKQGGFWQFVKFLLVSALAGIIQLALANLLPLLFDRITAPVPPLLRGIFVPERLFSASSADAAKYVVNGAVTWGYVLPFFLSNVAANVYAYFQNRKTTFHSDAPTVNFVLYFILLAALILFTTWLQGCMVGWLDQTGIAFLHTFARTIAAAAAGTVQLIVLFPVEKFVLLREKKSA